MTTRILFCLVEKKKLRLVWSRKELRKDLVWFVRLTVTFQE